MYHTLAILCLPMPCPCARAARPCLAIQLASSVYDLARLLLPLALRCPPCSYALSYATPLSTVVPRLHFLVLLVLFVRIFPMPNSFTDFIVCRARSGRVVQVGSAGKESREGGTCREYLDMRRHESVLPLNTGTVHRASEGTSPASLRGQTKAKSARKRNRDDTNPALRSLEVVSLPDAKMYLLIRKLL
ncbi:hypothetical protein BDW22DRAFT_62931 [Trametopsis cervina]|nr:hypothetical protein BDW22DRAFT_62931 [Trametopsis cervina]